MPLLYRTRFLRSSIHLFSLVAFTSMICGVCHAQGTSNGLIFNQTYGEGPNGTHNFEIATLPPSTTSTADHLHILATLNYGEGSASNTSIDAVFANRAGFDYLYTVRGAPLNGSVKLSAYQNSDGSVNIYLVFNGGFGVASYTVLENIQETVYATPTDLGSTAPTGTLLFDSSSSLYPPASNIDFAGDMSLRNNLGVGTAAVSAGSGGSTIALGPSGGYFWSGNNNEVISGSASGNVYLAPLGINGTNVSQSTGSLNLGGGTPGKLGGQPNATLNFPDGSTQSTAFVPGNTIVTSLQIQDAVGSGIGPILTLNNPAGLGNSAINFEGYSTATQPIQAQISDQDAGNWSANILFSTKQPSSGGALTERMRIANNGYVGIGTTTPSVPLEVYGSVKLSAGSGGSMTFQDGSVQSIAWTGVLQGGDYAESVDVIGIRSSYEPGDVMVIDPTAEGKFSKSMEPYSTNVTGIYSTRPGALGRRQKTDRSHIADEVPMAMIGVVPTKVVAEGGPIKPGDLLVTSSTPGYAMKGTDRNRLTGAIIGKALGHLDSGGGLIEVAVSLQ